MNASQKVAVITGSHKGLGLAIAVKLALKTDLRIIITSRNENDGLAARQRLAEEGRDVDYRTLDVDNDSSVARFAKWLIDTYGRVDVLINNAGINPTAQQDEADMLTARAETMMSTFSTNVLAAHCITQALVPLMQKNNYGRIVNVSSEMASLASTPRTSPVSTWAPSRAGASAPSSPKVGAQAVPSMTSCQS